MQQATSSRKREPTAFSVYLRTGRRVADRRVEVKFNPWHDPVDGRFTFAGRGSLYPAGGGASAVDPQSSPSKDRQDRANYSDPNYTDAQASAKRNDPKNPQNHSIYVVRPGDNLSRIARSREGVTAEDLAWLNEIPLDHPLQIGQRIKVPHQQYLDGLREAKNKALALDYYIRTRRQFPANPKNPPSLERQILDSNWRREAKNGYEFYIDAIGRSRQAYGLLHFGPSERSRKNQKGVQDRVPTDDGGHYIAARFEGPSDAFNHFAQNANFNRGAYRVLEDKWADALRAGDKVFVNIVPHYLGTSKRPDWIDVSWSVNGKRYKTKFANAPRGKADGAR